MARSILCMSLAEITRIKSADWRRVNVTPQQLQMTLERGARNFQLIQQRIPSQ